MQAFAIYLLFMTNFNDVASRWLLWNIWLGTLLAGPMPQVGHGADGSPIFEPTTIHVVMGFVGLALGVAAYSFLVYRGLRTFGATRSRQGMAPQ